MILKVKDWLKKKNKKIILSTTPKGPSGTLFYLDFVYTDKENKNQYSNENRNTES